ncbi:hypothetical protein CBL_11273 [Carabus blaptoides fortunei]
MAVRFLFASVALALVFESCFAGGGGGGGGGHKKVIIHVPYKIKHVHHTHTVYKHVGGGGGGDHDYYK